ncbi:hypothetical protein AM501_20595 [Aneurinibacillus migulanus]|uniref:DNA phosphorothioation-dependent restriction protein DptG n=1 Tax=Aneurinibacillus migulanus TaxID=47500 RepID=UPI0005BAD7F8|nr:DNA phosphorothioation-dependent restriction protein DptG [Aneurinibacillus migulanus]KIV56073.1 hypothetical protein TS64_11385 [Aneurinibacillus migulanus]KPD06597.1 hypothetical protein AM501_20595 [Aneurinibacillus migulanus]
MNRILEVERLQHLLESKKKHDVGRVIGVLPFLSKRTRAIRENFHSILGEYIRNICGIKLKRFEVNEEFFTSDNPFIEQIIKEVECEDDAAYDLKRFLEQYLFNQQNEIKPIHPYLFNYVSIVNTNHERELKKYAHFIKDTLSKDDPHVKLVFNNKESEDILAELILSKLDVLEAKKMNVEFQPILDTLATRYQEDLLFLSKFKDYFLSSFPILTHFYTFTYVCQLLLKFEQFDEADFSTSTPLYFALEWESISKRRKAADELEGFKRIKEKSPNLFIHIHTMSQLSHNSLNPDHLTEHPWRFMHYKEIKDRVNDQGPEHLERLYQDIKDWIYKYCQWASVEPKEEPQNLSHAFRILFGCLKEGMSTEVCEKYGGNIEDLGASVFLKNRGSLGPILNMNHEMLLLLTAVCVKEKRIPLNQLFEEFLNRGVAFDRYSKKEIIELFDSLNILDKKSDSGDAQYVKPIL